ncbi:MAG TPA: bifunctional acetate--CoA ligase family protein/GNAT family N-acetyltransferase [Burkholderiales bacterium]|nr:bifunctional acetate--CoA ligase family protein/GNAT family N-acetyltransferase [Burkholderiales bacterium]
MPHYLEPLFAPRSVAVVGASERAGSLGRAVFDNLRAGGAFAQQGGLLYPVNPKHAQVAGVDCYPRLKQLPAAADLTVVVTPARAVAEVLRDAGAAGCRHAVVLSAGFDDGTPDGAGLLHDAREAARGAGVRLLGPHSLGLMRPALGINATFARGGAHPGSLALVSQSGAVCAALTDWAWSAGIGFSSVIATGAAVDVDFGEVLDYLMFDSQTQSILLYIESIHDARRFISGLRACARTKPIVVLKAGRHIARGGCDFEAGEAVEPLSHAGHLLGDDAVFAAALRRSGVVRAESYSELFAIARLLAAGRMPKGRRLAILSNGGGPGIMAADRACDKGVPLATLSPATVAQLDAALPRHWSRANPVSLTGDVTVEGYAAALKPLLADPGIDGVLTLFAPQIVTGAAEMAQALLPLAAEARKPVLTAWLGEAEARAGREVIEQAGMPAFHYPESGVTAFAALADYTQAQALLLEVPPPLASSLPADVVSAHRLARVAAAAGRRVLHESESKQLLSWFGIATPRTVVAHSAEEAAALAAEIGYPLVLKIVSTDIIHKSDVGGVILNVRDAASLEREYRNLLERIGTARPDARLEGVAIQPMVAKRFGRELLVGVARDPVFGQVISFGAGGVAVELLGDHAVGLPPLNPRLAEELIAGTRIAALLGPYRHIPGADRDAIVDVLIKVSDMVCALPWLMEMDINPLLVDAAGAVALDARVVIDPDRLADDLRYSHMAIHPYPAALMRTETLRDGTQFLLRPIRPEDAAIETRFVESLSEQSRYMRFFNPIKSLSLRLLARLTQVDYDRELALLATQGEGAAEHIIGVVRYSPNADGVSCEFAIAIADDWHGRGLGSLLMRRLIEAARVAGYQRLTGSVLEGNSKMHSLMRRLGFAPGPRGADLSIFEYELDLTVPPGSEATKA